MQGKLLDLKEHREELKDRGAKHEDDILKENAILQVNRRLSFRQSFIVHSVADFFSLSCCPYRRN